MIKNNIIALFLSSFLILAIGMDLNGQCIPASGFSAHSISSTSATIDFSNSGVGPFEIEYLVAGNMLGSGTRLVCYQTDTTLSNLAPSTNYRIYVRRVCGASNSPWNSFSLTTNCATTISAPVRFDFESSVWQNPTSSIGTGNLGACWMLSPQGTNTYWSVGPPHETRLNTGPVGDHTSGFGKFLHLNAQGISQDSISQLRSPSIDLSNLTHPQVKFWYHLYGSQIDSLEIMLKVASQGSWDTVHTFYGAQQLSQEDPWLSYSRSLSDYKDSVIQLQFVGYGKGTEVQMAIDDLSFYDSTDCRRSSHFRLISKNDTSALLNWDVETGTSFHLEYGPPGFIPGTGTLLNVSAPPYRVSGLSPNSSYDIYLQDNCSGTLSNRTRALRLKTDCPALSAPYFVNFEGSTWPLGGLNSCWDRFTGYDFKWNVGPPGLNYSQSGPGANNHTPGGSKFIVADRPNLQGNARSSITTPLIDLDTINNPELVFWTHRFGLQITAFDVEIDSGDGYRLLRRYLGPEQLSKAAPWSEQIIAIPAYSGRRIKVKFTGIASSNWSSLSRIAIDDFSIGEAAPCRKPTNLNLDYRGFNSATISWLSGGAQNWTVKLETNGMVTTIQPNSSNPYYLSSLQPGTAYRIWVKDSCGAGLTSDWSAPIEFKTYCLPDTAPYFEDFEGSSFIVQSSWFSTGTLDPCWERSHELGPLWQPSPATILPNNLLPTADHTTGTGKYIGGTLFLGNGTNEPTSFTSKHIDLSTLLRPKLSFWYFLGGWSFSTNQLHVAVNDGTGWQTLKTINGPQQFNTSDAWLSDTLDLFAFRNDTIRLRFTSQGNNLYATAAGGVDDISIFENPNCEPPTDLEAKDVRDTEATLTWTTGGASNWLLKYRMTGSPYVMQNTSGASMLKLSGLRPGTTYEAWVRDSCAIGDVSPWHGPLFFTTECLSFTVPYYESFDGMLWNSPGAQSNAGSIDPCWRRSDTTYKAWLPASGGTGNLLAGPSSSRNGSGKYLLTETLQSPAAGSSNRSELRSPRIVLNGLQDPELNYWYHLFGPQIQRLWVYVEKSDESRVLIDTLVGQQQITASSQWQQRSVSILQFKGDTIKIVFVGQFGNGSGLGPIAIDDVEIIDRLCSGPTNLSASAITYNSAQLNWNSSGLATQLQYGLAGFSLGSGIRVLNAQSGYTLNNLQAFTTYEFYVEDTCRATTSGWMGPYAFTTSCSVPQAQFSEQSNGLQVSFDGSSSIGNALQYQWSFGDGTTANGLQVVHNYTIPGTYTVQLIVTDTCMVSDTVIRNLQVCELAQAIIHYNRTGLSVQFNGLSSTGAASYYWNFGLYGTDTNAITTLTFPAKGWYSLYLVVRNNCGQSDTAFFNLLICDQPVSSFTVNAQPFNGVLRVNFDGSASQFVDSFVWDFGDGSKDSTSLSPVHLYVPPNLSYSVSLITRADCGLSDTMFYTLNYISVEEEAYDLISIYPNPAKELLFLQTSNSSLKVGDLSCYDASGKKFALPLLSMEEGLLTFDVRHLAAGTYFLKFKEGPGSILPFKIQ